MTNSFTIESVKLNQRFASLTHDEPEAIDLLVSNCNKLDSKISGYIQTRKDILHNRFNRDSLVEIINFCEYFDKDNKFLVLMLKNLIEKVARDVVREFMVEDIMKALQLRLDACNGDVQRVADLIQHYYTYSDKITSFADTWREREEEVQKGMVIYNVPNQNGRLV